MSYDEDVSKQNASETGIKQECVYNKLPSFHVSDNVYCDLMHNILEGVCRYVMAAVLSYFIFTKRFITVHTFNSRICEFTYDYSSTPPCLSADHIKKSSLILSAIEMLNLTLGLSLMIGDLIPDADDIWELYLMLRKIVVFAVG